MYLTIRTPDQKVFEGSISKITLPGSTGAFQILKGHAPIVSTLVRGAIIYSNEHNEQEVFIEKGVVEVKEDSITILCSKRAG